MQEVMEKTDKKLKTTEKQKNIMETIWIIWTSINCETLNEHCN